MTVKVMNEEFVKGLVGAMKANSFETGGVTKVKVRYMGEFYGRGPIFKVEGTRFEGNMNEIEEAAIRSGCSLEILKRQEDRVVKEATSK